MPYAALLEFFFFPSLELCGIIIGFHPEIIEVNPTDNFPKVVPEYNIFSLLILSYKPAIFVINLFLVSVSGLILSL